MPAAKAVKAVWAEDERVAIGEEAVWVAVNMEDKRVAAETLAPESRAAWAEAKVAAENRAAGRVAVAESGCAACENAACAYAACGYGACGDGGRASVCAQTARGKHQHDSGPWEDQMGAHRSRQKTSPRFRQS